jgi:hypothetical protein
MIYENIEFGIVFSIQNSITLPKNGFGRKKWEINSHLGQ